MNKKLISMVLSLVLSFCVLYVPVMAEDTTSKDAVKAELSDTANALLKYTKSNIETLNTDTYAYNYYKFYTLIHKAGVSDEAVENSLLNFVKANFDADGATGSIIDASSLDVWYTYITSMLIELGLDATDYNGINFISLLENYYLNSANSFSPYLEQYIYALTDKFSDKAAITAKLQTTANSYYKSDNGISGMVLWGDINWLSADDNGQCLIILKSLNEADTDVATKISNALAWTKSQLGSDNTVNQNASSTALALKAFAEFNDMDNAASAYAGLISLQAADTNGAYPGYTGAVDYNFSTSDALTGLLAYYRVLCGKTTLEVINPSPSVPETTTPDNTTTAAQETTTPDNNTSPKTGDIMPVLMLMSVLAISACVYTVFSKRMSID